MRTETVILPAYLASALVNGDVSGIEDEDQKWIDAALEYVAPGRIVSAEGEPYFAHSCELSGHLACDVMEYTVMYDDPEMTEEFLTAYIECALWCGVVSDEDGTEHNEEFSRDDIRPEDMVQIVEDCTNFYAANAHLWEGEENYGDEQAGHDFYLTRNGHGAGFWDRGIANGDELSKAAKVYSSQGFSVGYGNEEDKEDPVLYMHN